MFLHRRRWAVTSLLWTAAALVLGGSSASAQGDGPRAYQIIPTGTRLLSLYGLYVRGNQTADSSEVIQGGDIDVNLGLLQYTQSLVVGHKQAALFGVLPFGAVSGSMGYSGGEVSGRNSGFGDLVVGAVKNIVGPPPLSPQQYVTYKPGFTFGILGKLTTPTGDYSSTKVLNLGANRWALQLGAPTCWYIGKSFIDPSLVTLELLPSVTLFTENSDPFGADRTEQRPLYRVEGHVTRNLDQAVWISLDALYINGGETSTDGVWNDDVQRSLSLGGTLNATINPAMSIKFTYGEIVSRNEAGPDGHVVRFILNYVL